LNYYYSCHVLEAIPFDGDQDGDGVINTLEDLNNNKTLMDNDTDGDGIFNFKDNDDDGDGTLTADEDYNHNGNYQDDDTNTNGIADYLDPTVTLSLTTNDRNLFSIMPNPARTTINIVFYKPQQQKYTWSISDATGKMVLKSMSNLEQTIDISALKSGVYFITVAANSTKTTKKIIVL
jgi:Secretion system C-terminal sorting domain